jgi:hypothetical protein
VKLAGRWSEIVKQEERVLARLTLDGAGQMDMHQRMELARWLHEHAMSLMAEGHNYSKKFTARYYAP